MITWIFQNTSVLENHHWRSAIGCLLESNIAETIVDVRTELEQQISSLILATDITRQQEFLTRFKVLFLWIKIYIYNKKMGLHCCINVTSICFYCEFKIWRYFIIKTLFVSYLRKAAKFYKNKENVLKLINLLFNILVSYNCNYRLFIYIS